MPGKTRGNALGPAVRRELESALGADVSHVRVHTGADSDQSARAVQARAFAVGRDVFFREGAYQPATARGRGLLAHEVVHTLQQHAAAPSGPPGDHPIAVSRPSDRFEQQASRVAGQVVALQGRLGNQATAGLLATPAPRSGMRPQVIARQPMSTPETSPAPMSTAPMSTEPTAASSTATTEASPAEAPHRYASLLQPSLDDAEQHTLDSALGGADLVATIKRRDAYRRHLADIERSIDAGDLGATGARRSRTTSVLRLRSETSPIASTRTWPSWACPTNAACCA